MLKSIGDQDRHNESVDTNNTGHDDGDDIYCLVSLTTLRQSASQHTLDDQVRSQNTHSANTDTRLCRSVRSPKAREYDGRRASHSTEEWLNYNQYDVLGGTGSSSNSWLLQDARLEGLFKQGNTDRVHRATKTRLAHVYDLLILYPAATSLHWMQGEAYLGRAMETMGALTNRLRNLPSPTS